MTIVQSLETLAKWLQENVCPKLTFKRPSDTRQDTYYDYEEVHPTAFAMFLPGSDKLSSGADSQCPYILVQLVDGSHDLINPKGRLEVQLSFMVWEPGIHPDENGMREGYKRTADGWKDVWELLERTVAEIENAEYLNGLRFVKENGVKYGQFSKDGQIADMYPYYYAWATMTIERGVNRIDAAYSEFL